MIFNKKYLLFSKVIHITFVLILSSNFFVPITVFEYSVKFFKPPYMLLKTDILVKKCGVCLLLKILVKRKSVSEL